MIALATHGYLTHMLCFKSARALCMRMASPRERVYFCAMWLGIFIYNNLICLFQLAGYACQIVDY